MRRTVKKKKGGLNFISSMASAVTGVNKPADKLAFIDAIKSNNKAVVNSFLTSIPPKINFSTFGTDAQGNTPVHYAVTLKDTAILLMLLAKKANIDTKNRYSRTPAMEAAASGNTDALKVLLSLLTDINRYSVVNTKDSNNNTIAALAVASNNIETAKLIIETTKLYNLKSEDITENKLLKLAINNFNAKIAKMLVDNKLGSDNIELVNDTAILNGDLKYVKDFYFKFSNNNYYLDRVNLDRAIKLAEVSGNVELINYFKEWSDKRKKENIEWELRRAYYKKIEEERYLKEQQEDPDGSRRAHAAAIARSLRNDNYGNTVQPTAQHVAAQEAAKANAANARSLLNDYKANNVQPTAEELAAQEAAKANAANARSERNNLGGRKHKKYFTKKRLRTKRTKKQLRTKRTKKRVYK